MLYVNILTVKCKTEYYLFGNLHFHWDPSDLRKQIFILLGIKDRKGVSINVTYIKQ